MIVDLIIFVFCLGSFGRSERINSKAVDHIIRVIELDVNQAVSNDIHKFSSLLPLGSKRSTVTDAAYDYITEKITKPVLVEMRPLVKSSIRQLIQKLKTNPNGINAESLVNRLGRIYDLAGKISSNFYKKLISKAKEWTFNHLSYFKR